MSEDREATDELVRLEIGAVAHGGSCVARHEGRVVFVRHTLPGEVVLARVETPGPQDRYWRADAVQILQASPERVAPRCDLSGPGGCGGCDWQHAGLTAQRDGKAAVIREQLQRLAGLSLPELGLPDVSVEAVPGDDAGLGWRTRVRFAVDGQSRPGLRRHRSHDIVAVPACPIAHPGVAAVEVGKRRWGGASAVEVVIAARPPSGASAADPLVIVEPTESERPAVPVGRRGRSTPTAPTGASGTTPPTVATPARVQSRIDLPPLSVPVSAARRGVEGLTRLRGRTWVEESVLVDGQERRFRVTGGGFWQVHPGAAQTLLDAVLASTDPQPGERALDLYCGVGLFGAGLAARVGDQGHVLGVEGDARACADARRNLHDLPQVTLAQGRVEAVIHPAAQSLAAPPWNGGVDVVVLDPPRAGAGRHVIQTLARLRPRVIAYVACDPAALARDLAFAAQHGYRLSGLRAFDLFPMTHHVECLATLVPTPDNSGEKVS